MFGTFQYWSGDVPFGGMIFPAAPVVPPVTPGVRLISRQGRRLARRYWHHGIDLAGPIGLPIYAVAGGTVVRASTEIGTYGRMVVIRHADDLYSLYAHLDTVDAAEGQAVEAGAVIGTLGNTTSLHPEGDMTPHLHFELLRWYPAASGDIDQAIAARYDALHELAAAGVALDGVNLVAAVPRDDYFEPGLAKSHYGVTSDGPVPPGRIWPWVAVPAVLLVGGYALLRGRRREDARDWDWATRRRG